LSLVLAGLTSLISICETYVAGFSEKFGISRNKAVTYGVGVAAIISFLFATNGGLYFLDVADYFVNQFGIAAIGLVEVVAIAWFFKKLPMFEDHANAVSDIRLGAWWQICLKFVTPLVLGYMLFGLLKLNLLKQFENDTGNYEGYSNTFILYCGWFVAAGVIILGFVMTAMKWNKNTNVDSYQHTDGE
jgi:NSS family neurotransmitter:Na+ symporter